MSLPTDIAACHVLILEQQKQIIALSAKLLELEERLNKNSRNSHKPPSSDGLSKPAKRKPAFDKKKGLKSGGQKGHQGKTLEMVAKPKFVKNLLPNKCSCGAILSKQEAKLLEARQVFDIPKPQLEVTEYRRLSCTCGHCGEKHEGTFPEHVKARVQYGLGVQSLVVLLNIHFKLPLNKLRELFSDLYGYAINESTIVSATQKCYDRLQSSEEAIKQAILSSKVAFFDETGLRVKAKLHWLHTACTDMYTYLFVHPKRGCKALESDASLLPAFRGRAVHDCWSSYFAFLACLHAICGAHLLRELEALSEKGSEWAKLFKQYLLALYECSQKGTDKLDGEQQKIALILFDTIWEMGDVEEPPPESLPNKRGRKKSTKGRNLLNRLKGHKDEVLAFAFYEEVPFTNNTAERALRVAKTKQKVSGGFRTFTGAEIYARIEGFVSTIRKQQLSAFEQLKLALADKPTSLTELKAVATC